MPRSNVKNQVNTDSNVYHSPRTSLLLKYRIKIGVEKKEIAKAMPFIINAYSVFLATTLVFPFIFLILENINIGVFTLFWGLSSH